MRTILQSVLKCDPLIDAAQVTAQGKHRIVVFRQQGIREFFQFLKAFSDLFGIALMGLNVSNRFALLIGKTDSFYHSKYNRNGKYLELINSALQPIEKP